jgi:alginate O-acetyltransferase complex protein AlgI
MQQAIHNILGLFGINGDVLINKETIYYLSNYLGILVIAIIGSTPILKNIIEKLKEKSKMRKVINLLEPIVIIILLLLSTAYILDNSYNPFLYFRF